MAQVYAWRARLLTHLALVLAMAATTVARDSVLPTLKQNAKTSRPAFESALGWQPCVPEHVHVPTCTDEVAELVDVLYHDKKVTGRDYFLRALQNLFYAHNNLSCAEAGESTALPVMIDMSRMDRVLGLDKPSGLVTVQAGMTFEAFEDYLLAQGLGLPGLGASPPYAGMSLGAALESGAHGSSLDGPASLAQYLEAAVLVDGTGQVLVLESPGDLLEGSLGMLGVVTELSVRVAPARKASVREIQAEDLHMLEDVREVIEKSQATSLELTWSPAASIFTARVWHSVGVDTPGEAVAVGVAAPAEWLEGVETLLQQDQEDQEASSVGYDIMCEVVGDVTGFTAFARRGLGSDAEEAEISMGDGLSVGWANRMGAARCGAPPRGGDGAPGAQRACLWGETKVTPHTLSIPSEQLASWVDDVRRVIGASASCPSFLVHMRFVMAAGAPLAPSSGHQVVSINLESLSSRHYAGKLPHKQQDLLDEVLQLSLCKYGGRPHWALSTNRMLTSACGGRAVWGAGLDVFAARRTRYDPSNLFLHPLYTRVAGGVPPEPWPGCAITEDCFCSDDAHCGPGFTCVPGKAFPEYRVCRMTGNEDMVEL